MSRGMTLHHVRMGNNNKAVGTSRIIKLFNRYVGRAPTESEASKFSSVMEKKSEAQLIEDLILYRALSNRITEDQLAQTSGNPS